MKLRRCFIALALLSAFASTVPASAQSLPMFSALNGELTRADKRDKDGAYFDEISIIGRKGQRARILVESQAFAPFAVLTTAERRVIATAQGGIANPRQLINVTFPADGSYKLMIVSQSDQLGRYSAEMAEPKEAMPKEIVPGDVVQGNINVGDRMTSMFHAFDVYEMATMAGQTLVLELNTLAGLVLIVSPESSFSRMDGGSPNVQRILLKPKEDTVFRIAVAEGSRGRGAYRLSVTDTKGSAGK